MAIYKESASGRRPAVQAAANVSNESVDAGAPPALTDEETRTLIDYARRKFAEERWPLSPALREVRAVIEKLDPKPEPAPLPEPAKTRVEPSWRMARKRRR